jgi:hypothetical protein
MGPHLLAVVILLVAAGASPAQAECGNARWWYGDDSDPDIQQYLIQSRLMATACVWQDRPATCAPLVRLGERFLDYLLLQYEHARASESRTHQGQSLLWLSSALRFADLTRSQTAIRYIRDYRDAIFTPPRSIESDYWASSVERVLLSACLDTYGRPASSCS